MGGLRRWVGVLLIIVSIGTAGAAVLMRAVRDLQVRRRVL